MKHGIRLDLEFLAIVIGAGVLAYFVSGDLVSNALFTGLLSILFFLMGLHLDIDKLKRCGQHRREVLLGLAAIYLLAPALAFLVYTAVGGALGDAFIAIGVSAAAIGSPVVFSNLSKGEGDLALIVSGTSLLAGFVVIPVLLLGFPASLPFRAVAVKNLAFLFLPLAAGLFSQRFENVLMEDMKHHFSKVGLWLLVMVMAVQFRLVYAWRGAAMLQAAGFAIVLMAGFTTACFTVAYYASRYAGSMEPQARALGFVSSSKSLAVSLFVASQISGGAVAYVGLYYFVRQAVTGSIMEYFRHGEPKTVKKSFEGLLDLMPGRQ
ncbi:MAG: bile acid:sodium symporter family protein [Candidatus Nanohaloarchaea archaeon]